MPTLERYVLQHPTCRSIKFSGQYLDLYAMAEDNELDRGYLWRVLTGQRTASVTYYTTLCHILELTLADLLSAIAERRTFYLDRQERRAEL